MARYDDDGQSVVIGVWPQWKNGSARIDDRPFVDMRSSLDGVNRSYKNAEDEVRHIRMRGTEIKGYPANAFAFNAVEWRVNREHESGRLQSAPLDPANERVVRIDSTARVYGLLDDHVVMIRIDRVNTDDPEPPSEEDLRSLWDKQVAKIEQLGFDVEDDT